MSQRAFVLAAVVLFAAGQTDDDKRLGTDCRMGVCTGDAEAVVCCFDDLLLNPTDGTCSNTTFACGLCDQTDLPPCPRCRSVAPIVGIRNGVSDNVTCWPQEQAGPAPPLPLRIPRTDGGALSLGTFNNMLGWGNVPSSTFFGFQEFLLGLTAYIPHYTQRANFEIALRCDRESIDPNVEGCSMFFFVYRCPPCEAHTGNLEESLLALSEPVWSVNRCGPTFKLHPEGATHQFALYSTEVVAPFTFSILLEQDIAFTFWALVGRTVVCAGIETEDECNRFPVNCVFDRVAGICKSRDCVFNGGQAGPGLPRCAVCVDEELIPTPPYTN